MTVMLKSIFKNISALFIARFLAQGLAFITTIYVSRTIGVQGFGILGFATAVMAYLDFLGNLGLEYYAVREVSRNPDRLNFFISNIISLRAISSITIFLIIFLIGFALTGTKLAYSLLIIYVLSLFLKGFSLLWTFQALSRMELLGLGQIINQLVYLFSILLLVRTFNDIIFVPVAYNLGILSLVVYTWVLNRNRIKHIAFRFNLQRWAKMLKISLPIVGSFIVLRINWNLGLLVLGSLSRSTEAGIYNAGLKIFIVLIAFREILITVHYPLLSKFYIMDFDELKKVMELFIKISLIIALPIIVWGSLLSKEIVLFLFKEQYGNASGPLTFLLIGYGFLMLNIVYPSGQNAFNRQNIYFKTSLQVAGVSLLLNLILIPLLGAKGAAMSMASSEMLSFLLFRWRSTQVVKVRDFYYVWRLFPSLLILTIAIIFLSNLNIVINALICILIYFITLPLFHVITKREMAQIRGLIFRK